MSIGSSSPFSISRTRIARFFVSTDSSVIWPILLNLVLTNVRAASASAASFDPRRNVWRLPVVMRGGLHRLLGSCLASGARLLASLSAGVALARSLSRVTAQHVRDLPHGLAKI